MGRISSISSHSKTIQSSQLVELSSLQYYIYKVWLCPFILVFFCVIYVTDLYTLFTSNRKEQLSTSCSKFPYHGVKLQKRRKENQVTRSLCLSHTANNLKLISISLLRMYRYGTGVFLFNYLSLGSVSQLHLNLGRVIFFQQWIWRRTNAWTF